MDSLGNEAATQFSLSFDPAIFSSPVVNVGSGAPPGSSVTVNPNQLGAGRIGILVDSVNTYTASPPARQILTVTFTVAPGAPLGITPITFGSQPSEQGVSDGFGNTLPASYVDGTVTIATAALGFESDVAPRPNGNNQVVASDVTQMRRFATGLDVPNPATNEFQRADSAPRGTLGNGVINGADVIQTRRYSTGLDPLTGAGGPPAGTSIIPETLSSIFEDVYAYFFGREVRVTAEKPAEKGKVTVAVEITPYGDEMAAGFTLEYDAAKLSNPQLALGEAAPAGAVLTANTNEAGRIGILVDSTEAFMASATPKRFLMVTFDVAAGATGETPVTLTDSLASKTTADANGNTLTVRYLDGTINLSDVFGQKP